MAKIRNFKLTVIDKLTRITSTSATLPDLMITNKREIINDLEVSSSQVADHELIAVIIRKPKVPVSRSFRCFKTYDQNHFCDIE